MIKVIFYNLLRSKYRINETLVNPGTISNIIEQILDKYQQMKQHEFDTAVVFHKGKPIHSYQFSTVIEDFDEIIFTHFVGGG
jgi:glutamate mutase epsilon subunit